MLHDQRSCVYTKYLLEPKYFFKFGRTTGGKKKAEKYWKMRLKQRMQIRSFARVICQSTGFQLQGGKEHGHCYCSAEVA